MCGDRGGQINRGPRKSAAFVGNQTGVRKHRGFESHTLRQKKKEGRKALLLLSYREKFPRLRAHGPRSAWLRGIRPLSTGGKWTERPPGGLFTKGEMPPGPPVRLLRRCWAKNSIPAPWLPLTRELSPQATEGENSQPAPSEHPAFSKLAVSLPPSNSSGLPPPSSEGGKTKNGGRRDERPPTTPCLPCVRGGAERMRSGGVVGLVQEKMSCNRQPVPLRHPQPLSQGLSALPAPLTQGSQAPRGTKAKRRATSYRPLPLFTPAPRSFSGSARRWPPRPCGSGRRSTRGSGNWAG